MRARRAPSRPKGRLANRVNVSRVAGLLKVTVNGVLQKVSRPFFANRVLVTALEGPTRESREEEASLRLISRCR